DCPGSETECERLAELVARERELPESRGRDQVARRDAQRLLEDSLRLRVVRRVTRLAHALLVREPERVERLDVARVEPQLALQAEDLRLGVAGGESLGELDRDRVGKDIGRSGGRARPEHAGEEECSGGEDR